MVSSPEENDEPICVPVNIQEHLNNLQEIVVLVNDSKLRVKCLKHDIEDLTRDRSDLDAKIKASGTTSVTYNKDLITMDEMRAEIMQYHRDMVNWNVIELNLRFDYTQILLDNPEVHNYISQSLRI